MQPVNGFADHIACSIEAEGEIGTAQIVVNGLGHTHDPDALFMQLLCDGERVIASNCDKRLDLMFL